jgi:hypothetical protein
LIQWLPLRLITLLPITSKDSHRPFSCPSFLCHQSMGPSPKSLENLHKLFDALDTHLNTTSKQKPTEKRPNKHTDRVAWNEHFEKEISAKYRPRGSNPPAPLEETPNLVPETWDLPSQNQALASRLKDLMAVEGRLIASAMTDIVYGTFEADWKALDPEKKKEIVLEGLYRGACAAPRDNSRVMCPEMTVKNLVGDGEYNLINLVRSLISFFPLCCLKFFCAAQTHHRA